MTLRTRIAILAALAVASLTLASATLAGSWTLTTGRGVYAGTCNELPNGGLNCHGTLVSGSPEQGTISSGSCNLVLAPSGRAIMNCR